MGDVQAAIHHLVHAVDDLTREWQGLLQRRRRQSSGHARWARWGWIDVHRLVLEPLKSRWRWLRHGLRRSSRARVAYLDESHHPERDEGAKNELDECDLNVDPSGS